ncbi:MAG: L-lysine 6-transaminase [Candidatus Coatesbacteria bacterium]|nr:L-lysine 6-transaminase [Candidatus Coatesbacteria bacterium]
MTDKLTPQQVLPTLQKHMLADGFGDIVFDPVKSQGAILHDMLHDRDYIDLFTFFASSPIGYNHPHLTSPEFLKKLGRIAVNKTSNSDIYTVEMAEFVETFVRVAMPDYMKYLFFVSGGGLAVENAMKTAFDWKTKQNLQRGIWSDDAEAQAKEDELVIIHFRQAFHGRTGYTLSVTNTDDARKYKYFPKFDWPRISSPGINFSLPEPERWEFCAVEEERAVAEIRRAIALNPNKVAAILIEPIQAEGGDRHFRTEFHKWLRELADEAEALLIHDEVQTGFGLTGRFWASEHYDVRPDIICFGKKSQVCGIIVGDRLDTVKYHVFSDEADETGAVPGGSRLNSTWGGNLVDMVRCQAYLEVIEEERLVDNAAEVGTHLLTGLYDALEGTPGTAARGVGLMMAFDLPTAEMRNEAHGKLLENGLFTITCGPRSIRFRPPLILTRELADKSLDIVHETLKKMG